MAEDAKTKEKKAPRSTVDRKARAALLALLPILESQSWPVDVRDAIDKLRALKG